MKNTKPRRSEVLKLLIYIKYSQIHETTILHMLYHAH